MTIYLNELSKKIIKRVENLDFNSFIYNDFQIFDCVLLS